MAQDDVAKLDASLLHGPPPLARMRKELGSQLSIGGPLALNFFFLYLQSIVTMSFLGHRGAADLAAASLAMAAVSTSARLLIAGLCGGADTQASQAYGSGRHGELPVIFQRTALFLALHLVPASGLALLGPTVFRLMGTDEEACVRIGHYIYTLLPGVWVEVLDKPMNSVLVAQHITRPQMGISAAVVVLHVATNTALARLPAYSFLHVGAASSLAVLYNFLILASYVAWRGYGSRVFGTRPMREALQGWGPLARLAYPAAGMRCMESFCYTGMTILAGFLPDRDVAVSAIGLAFNTYGVAFMSFLGVAVSCGTRVGNALGAHAPGAARVSALTAIAFVPAIWVPIALMLIVPLTQGQIVRFFVKPSTSPEVATTFGHLLYIVAFLELVDGLQTVMGGVLTGVGKQLSGAAVNFVAFYVIALPTAVLLAFRTPLQVYGLYLGIALGPLLQCVLFYRVIRRIDWQREASSRGVGSASGRSDTRTVADTAGYANDSATNAGARLMRQHSGELRSRTAAGQPMPAAASEQ